MENTIKILKERTLNLFNDKWYEETAAEIHSPNSKNEFGYIYFVRIGTTIKCKIGFSSNIIKRINSFKTTLGNNIILDSFIYCKNYSLVEKEIHLILEKNRIHGEWFTLPIDLMKQITEKYNGVLILCSIDNNLIIEDGVFVSGNKINSNILIASEEKIAEKIYSFMRYKNITVLKSSPKEIYQFLFSSEQIFTYKIILRWVKSINNKISNKKSYRYKSVFDGEIRVGTPYIINLPTEGKSN